MTLYYEEQGQGVEAVLLLHGWGFDARVWQSLAALLRQHYRVILVDLPGFGRSKSVVMPDTMSELAHMVLPLLSEAHYLIGWSLGGLLAQHMALYYPNRVGRVLSIASSPRFLEAPGWRGVTKERFDAYYRAVVEHPSRALLTFAQQLVPIRLRARAQSLIADSTRASLQNGLRILEKTDYRAQIAHSAQVQWCFGLQDHLAHPNHLALSFTYPGRGHMPMLSVTTALHQWITSVLSDD